MATFDFVKHVLNKPADRKTFPITLGEDYPDATFEDGTPSGDTEYTVRRMEGKLWVDAACQLNRAGMTADLAIRVLSDCFFQSAEFLTPVGAKYAQRFIDSEPRIAACLAVAIIGLTSSDQAERKAVDDAVKNS